jgi:hypothetical protein
VHCTKLCQRLAALQKLDFQLFVTMFQFLVHWCRLHQALHLKLTTPAFCQRDAHYGCSFKTLVYRLYADKNGCPVAARLSYLRSRNKLF